uniref:Uncharacterized protein n=1 Tax=Chrysotila carterae TaxID=13221 RepID=A0A7S4EX91_CHRCT
MWPLELEGMYCGHKAEENELPHQQAMSEMRSQCVRLREARVPLARACALPCARLRSCTDADEEDSVLSTSSSFSNTSRRALASRLSGQSPAHVIPPASAQKSSSERHYAPMASTERAKRSGEAEAAIEAQWEQAEGKLRDAQDNTALRGEIEQLKATLKHARKDAKYLRERMEQMAAENRVLRRDPRKGKRDAVIEQLEVELQRKEQVRAALAADACARRRR